MSALAKERFRKYCLADVEKHEKFCKAHGLMDSGSSLLLGVFRENFRKTEPEWALGVSAVVAAASHFATIHEYLGGLDKVRQYLWLGSHEWNYGEIDYPDATGCGSVLKMTNIADRVICADDLVLQQLPAAVCSDRIGEGAKASRLYGWVAQLRDMPDRGYELFLGSFLGRGSYCEAWGRKTERAYALACLGRWDEALAEARSAKKWVEKDRKSNGDHAWKNHLRLLQALSPLIAYKLNPTGENKQAAREELKPRIPASGDYARTIFLLFYLSNLKTKFPELVG
jgi:hypothetical protein